MFTKKNLSSSLAKAKNLGAARNGTSTWIMQRISAVALLPLSIWFVFLVLKVISSSYSQLYSLVASPLHTCLMLSFIGAGIYHGSIGAKEIIEDYVHCEFAKICSIIFIRLFSIFTVIASSCAILALHFSSYK